MNTLSKITKKSSIFFLTLATAAIMAGCGQTSDNKPANTQNDVQPEQTVDQEVVESSAIEVSEETVVEESTVETEVVEEPDTTNLTDEKWLESLNLETGTFLIFNETTGERKVLEDGQQYTLLEGDELAFGGTLDWDIKNGRTSLSYNLESEYDCAFIRLNTETFDNEEFIMDVDDADGNRVSFTIYLSK